MSSYCYVSYYCLSVLILLLCVLILVLCVLILVYAFPHPLIGVFPGLIEHLVESVLAYNSSACTHTHTAHTHTHTHTHTHHKHTETDRETDSNRNRDREVHDSKCSTK